MSLRVFLVILLRTLEGLEDAAAERLVTHYWKNLGGAIGGLIR